MFLKSLKLTNFLSFGDADAWVDLRPLNVIIGPNAAGKSNFIEAISFLRSASGLSDNNNLLAAIGRGGGVQNWIWNNAKKGSHVSLDAIFDGPHIGFSKGPDIHYHISFNEARNWFHIVDEKITRFPNEGDYGELIPYYCIEKNRGFLRSGGAIGGTETPIEINHAQSILSNRSIPQPHDEVLKLSKGIYGILIYNEWTFGHKSPPRLFQQSNALNFCLDSDAANLGLILNKIRTTPEFKEKFFHYLTMIYDNIVDFDARIVQGMIQVIIREKSGVIPATQLSDGTLRYMSLLAVLCDPEPRPLVCIEEPELGLHPDIIPHFADLLRDASERTQLVVTTHSDFLVDALSDQPEAVLVAERQEDGTHLNRLDARELEDWLEKFRLGELWVSGKIGGTRW